MSERTSQQIKAEIEARFGFFPPFFEPAWQQPAVLETLWQQTLSLYVNNPLPTVLKERLFAYLSRYCSVPYCIICHSCALRPLGMTAEQILALIAEPAPFNSTALQAHLATLNQAHEPLEIQHLEDLDLAESLFYLIVFLFLKPRQAESYRQAIRRVLGEANYIHLSAFLAYVRSCHQWVENYPELSYEADQRARSHLSDLLQAEPSLAEFFQQYSTKVMQEQQWREEQLATAIADLQHTEEALRCSEERFRIIFDHAAVGIGLADRQSGRYLRVNQCFCQLLGYTEAEMTQLTWKELTHPDDLKVAQTCGPQPTPGERPNFSMEKRYVGKDGKPRWVKATVSIVHNSVENPEYIICVIEDIEQRRQAEAAILSRNRELLAIHKISEIALSVPSSTSAFEAITGEISTATGYPIVAIELYDKGRQVMVFKAATGITLPSNGNNLEVPVEQTLSGTVASTGERVVKHYAPQESKKCDSNETLAQLGIKTFICLPLIVHQDTIGVLSLGHSEIAQIDDDFLTWLDSLASMLALLIDSKQSEEALRTSEERFRSLSACSPVGIYVADPQGYCTYTNPRCQEIFGFSAEEALGSGWAQLVYEDDREWLFQEWAVAAAAGQPYFANYRVQPQEGTIRWVQTRTAAMLSNQGELVGHVGTIEDISDRKQAEAALQQSEYQYRILVEASQDMIWSVDTEGRYTFVNSAVQQIYGYQPEEMIGCLFRKFQPLEQISKDLKVFQQVLAGESIQRYETVHLAKDGKPINLLFTARAIHDEAGNVLGTTGTASDITQQKQTQIALQEKEAQYRSVFESTTDALHIFDMETGLLVEANPAACQMHGYSYEEFLSLHPTAFVHPDYHPLFGEFIETVRAGKIFHCEAKNVRRDGTAFDIDVKGTGLLYDGKPHILSIVRDISDRKRSEAEIQQLNAALEEQNRNLEALVEQRTAELQTFISALPDYIFVIDREDMRLTFCNELLAKLAGYETPDQIQGQTIFECFLPDLAAEFANQNRQVFATGETLHYQETYTSSLGTMYFDTYKIPLRKPNGEVYALIGSSRDIRELVMIRQALTERSQQLEEMNRELESFSYSVSHDLRAPLRHVNGFVVALKQELAQMEVAASPKVLHYLQIIEDSGKRMGLLIDGLLSLSRVGRRQLEKCPVNLMQLVEQAICLVKGNLEADTSVEFTVRNLPVVEGDPVLLQQVFSNLVDNAVKFSRRRGTVPTEHPTSAQIEIGNLPDGIIFVKDNGVGFSMDYADQLFGAFQRLHSRSEFEGTGIGLAIVQRIIHRHGGIIWAESQPDQGACFYFKLASNLEESIF